MRTGFWISSRQTRHGASFRSFVSPPRRDLAFKSSRVEKIVRGRIYFPRVVEINRGPRIDTRQMDAARGTSVPLREIR